MPRNGSGSYLLPTNSWNPATNGNSATPADWQALINDVASAIQGSVASDGETPMTGDLQMGNNSITGLAAAATLGDGLRLENLIAGADIASATSVTIPLEGNFFKITGTTTVAGFASTRSGRSVWVTFSGILTLTNSSSFYMPNASDITTAAGDIGLFVYDGTAWHCVLYRPLVPANPAFSAYATVGTAVNSGAWAKVAFGTKEFDTNTNFDTTASRFTPTVAGYYQINANLNSNGNAQALIAIYKNGTIFKTGNGFSSTSPYYISASALVYMNGSTDYLEIFWTQTSGAPGTSGTGSSSTYFQGFLARPA